ncbi:MAG: hypothetical protein JW891_02950 [Candidatus Lokiarchaeota archaeon]|nr:hypothetical protein [Candidatus Lokiarchaeota archaeon]
MKCKNLCLLFIFIFIFISASYVFAEPYKSAKFPPDDALIKTLNKFSKKYPGVKSTKYIGKRQIEKNLCNVYFSIEGAAVGINLEELGVLSATLYKLDNDIWILDDENTKMVIQK